MRCVPMYEFASFVAIRAYRTGYRQSAAQSLYFVGLRYSLTSPPCLPQKSHVRMSRNRVQSTSFQLPSMWFVGCRRLPRLDRTQYCTGKVIAIGVVTRGSAKIDGVDTNGMHRNHGCRHNFRVCISASVH